MQPSELEQLPFYEYHYLVKDLTEYLKQEKDANERQSAQIDDTRSTYKQPSMPKFNQPRVNVPKI